MVIICLSKKADNDTEVVSSPSPGRPLVGGYAGSTTSKCILLTGIVYSVSALVLLF